VKQFGRSMGYDEVEAMKPRTGRFPKHIDISSEFAAAVSGMASPRPRRCKSNLVVVAIDKPLCERSLRNLGDGFRQAGLKVLFVNTSCKVVAVNSPQTFFRAGDAPRVRCFADGKEMERVRWCETAHGLVCQVDGHGMMTVRKFRSVKVVLNRDGS